MNGDSIGERLKVSGRGWNDQPIYLGVNGCDISVNSGQKDRVSLLSNITRNTDNITRIYVRRNHEIDS